MLELCLTQQTFEIYLLVLTPEAEALVRMSYIEP